MALTIFLAAIVVWFFVSVLFLLAVLAERNDIADVGWGIGVMLTGVVALGINGAKGPVISLLLALVLVWCIRLSSRVLLRNSRKAEDYRYRLWRETWSGRWFYTRTYLYIYLRQAGIIMLVSAPLLIASLEGNNQQLDIFSYVGAFIWLVGFAFEAIGDFQLDEFKKDPLNRGKILMSGLWKYTRHPNYFGEILMWWGIFIVVWPLPMSSFAIIGPITVTYLILRLTGIPAVEERLSESQEWRVYKAATSRLLPLPTATKIGQILICKLN